MSVVESRLLWVRGCSREDAEPLLLDASTIV
jgi:hypothetical protein